MFRRFRSSSIHNKLLTTFAITVLIGALSVVVSMATLLRLRDLSAELKGYYQSAQHSYQAQTYLQELERVEKSFILTGDEGILDDFLVYIALFDEYLRQAELEATSAEIKSALFEIQRAQFSYIKNFEQTSKTVVFSGIDALDEALVDQLTEDMNTMGEELFVVSQYEWENFALAKEEQDLFLFLAALVNIIAVVLFLILATFTILAMSRGIFAPAHLLSQASKAVIQREYSPEMLSLISGQTDEIGQLAQAFIQMVSVVEAREELLELQIEEARAKLERHI